MRVSQLNRAITDTDVTYNIIQLKNLDLTSDKSPSVRQVSSDDY